MNASNYAVINTAPLLECDEVCLLGCQDDNDSSKDLGLVAPVKTIKDFHYKKNLVDGDSIADRKISAVFSALFLEDDDYKNDAFSSIEPGVKRFGEKWLKITQAWVGRITFVDHDCEEFVAVITDKTHPCNPDEEVVIGIEDIKDGDKILVQEGAVFYWNVGIVRINEKGTRKNRYDLRFRRMPNFSDKDIEYAREVGSRIAAKIHGN